MKILFLIGGLSVQDGGTANEIVRLSELLCIESDFQITVACLTPKFRSIKLNERINYIEFKGFNILSRTFLTDLRNLKEVIDENDITYCTGIWGPIDALACRISIRKGKPTYLRICGMLEPYIIKRNWFKKSLAFKLYLKSNLLKASGIIVNSHREAKNVIRFGIPSIKIKIIPPCVGNPNFDIERSAARLKLGIYPNEKVLLYLGRIHPKKGLHLLLPALAIARQSLDNLKLLVAGEFWNDEYKKKILNLVEDLNLHKIIQFSGLVVGDLKHQHFIASDVFVLPSQSEGLPNAVLESMSYGMPVIISPECNIPEVEDKNCGIITDMNVKDLADAIIDLIDNLSEINYSQNCKELIASKFSEIDFLNAYKRLSTAGINYELEYEYSN